MKLVRLALITAFASLTSTTSAHAAEYPALQSRDYWTYRQVIQAPGQGDRINKVRFTVEYFKPGGVAVVFASDTDAPLAGAENRTVLRPQNAAYQVPADACPMDALSGIPLSFTRPCNVPDREGATWYTATNDSRLHTEFSYRVVGPEFVETPAGKFKAIKLDSWRYVTPVSASGSAGKSAGDASVGTGVNTAAIEPSRSGDNAKKYHTVYWYAPEVRGMVKVVRYFTDNAGAPTFSMSEELLAYGNHPAGVPVIAR
ncbi:MAG: hypothetical protein V4488_07425 [Pseudomonadota bacterium]